MRAMKHCSSTSPEIPVIVFAFYSSPTWRCVGEEQSYACFRGVPKEAALLCPEGPYTDMVRDCRLHEADMALPIVFRTRKAGEIN